MIALFLVHEVLRWFAPWGSWLGGPGFTYQRVDDDNGSTEMKDFSPENKIPWMNNRSPKVRTDRTRTCSDRTRTHVWEADDAYVVRVVFWFISNRRWW
jgi:hypothetical protein